jgi:hypothetical protein
METVVAAPGAVVGGLVVVEGVGAAVVAAGPAERAGMVRAARDSNPQPPDP